ncbi:MAG: hypothetical protein WDN03_02010 [Rhizomicrobium sp.]
MQLFGGDGVSFAGEEPMREPETSNAAQQRQAPAAGVSLDPLANRTVPTATGAVHGGEATKPGQMQGDEDLSPGAPERRVEAAVRQPARAQKLSPRRH